MLDLNTIPVDPPPLGVTADLKNPQSRRPEILAIGIPFITIASIFFLIRVYVKAAIIKKWRLDDSEFPQSFFNISTLKIYH